MSTYVLVPLIFAFGASDITDVYITTPGIIIAVSKAKAAESTPAAFAYITGR